MINNIMMMIVLIAAWADIQRWEKGDKVGESVILSGHFAAIGLLANSVHDAQPVHSGKYTQNLLFIHLIILTFPSCICLLNLPLILNEHIYICSLKYRVKYVTLSFRLWNHSIL